MKKNVLVDQAQTPDGSVMTLYEHDGAYSIRIGGEELMSTRRYRSEQVIAETVCKRLGDGDVSILIGGLGMGFTLRSVLEAVSAGSRVVTAELMPCVIDWNANPDLPLAYDAMKDERSKVVNEDVLSVIQRSSRQFHAIILDVDNGPAAMTTESNRRLYDVAGLAMIKSALKPGGVLGVWSAGVSKEFETLLKRGRFRYEIESAYSRGRGGSKHTLYLATAS